MKRLLRLLAILLPLYTLPTFSQVNYQQQINERCQALLDSAEMCQNYTAKGLLPQMHDLVTTMQTKQPIVDSLLQVSDVYDIQRYRTALILDSLSTLIIRKGEEWYAPNPTYILQASEKSEQLINTAMAAVNREVEIRKSLNTLLKESLEFALKHNIPVSSDFYTPAYICLSQPINSLSPPISAYHPPKRKEPRRYSYRRGLS